MSEAVSQLRAIGVESYDRPLIAQTETARVDDKCVRNAGDGIDQKGRIPPAERSQTPWKEYESAWRVLVLQGLTRPNVVL